MRYHSISDVLRVLKRLGWVRVTEETEPSGHSDNYPAAPERVYYRLTKVGKQAGVELLGQIPCSLYIQEIGPAI